MRILVIEDDDAVRDVLDRGLRAEGFDVDLAPDGEQGLWQAIEGEHAAIVLDLLLPGINGYEVCAKLRAEAINTPILVLSAKSGEYDQVDLLDLGADDYLTKPASIAVLAARLRAIIRRRAMVPTDRIERGALRYDFSSRTCQVCGVPVTLTSREGQLLEQLLLAGEGFVTRHELLDRVWGAAVSRDPSNVDIYLRRLRAKVAPVVVENVRGVGFRIASSR